MNYENFMRIVDKWSENDIVCFLMEHPLWNEMFMRFIMHNWREVFTVKDIAEYSQLNDIVLYTDLEGGE